MTQPRSRSWAASAGCHRTACSQESAATDSSRGPHAPTEPAGTHQQADDPRVWESTTSLDLQSYRRSSTEESGKGARGAGARTSERAWRLPSIKALRSQQHPPIPCHPHPCPPAPRHPQQRAQTPGRGVQPEAHWGPRPYGIWGQDTPAGPSATKERGTGDARVIPRPGVPANALACLVNNDFTINIP